MALLLNVFVRDRACGRTAPVRFQFCIFILTEHNFFEKPDLTPDQVQAMLFRIMLETAAIMTPRQA